MPTDQAFLDSLVVRPIGRDLDLRSFKCETTIDWFLTAVACEHHEKRITAVTCWLHERDVAGYITTSMSVVELSDSPQRDRLGLKAILYRKDGKHNQRFPALLIGMLGVCREYGRRGLGLHMVKHAIGQGIALSRNTGCRFVAVDSDPTDEAMGLYEAAGFKQAEGQKNRKTVLMYFDLGPRPQEVEASASPESIDVALPATSRG